MYVFAQRLQHHHPILIFHSPPLIHSAVTPNNDLNDSSIIICREGACEERGRCMCFAQYVPQLPTDSV